MSELAPISQKFTAPWLRFNVWFFAIGVALVALNIGLPFALKYIHPYAEYIEVDAEGLIVGLLILWILGDAAYWVLVGLVSTSSRIRVYRHALAACLVLALLAWLLSRFYVVDVIPTLLYNPELLCD